MRLLFILFVHLVVTLVRLTRPAGIRAVAAESLAVRHQLLIMKRAQRRSPSLTARDQVILGVRTLLVSPKRWGRMAVILKTSTLMRLHRALVKRKYRLLYTPKRGGRPGPRIIVVMDVFTRRIVGFGASAANFDGIDVCWTFNRAIAPQTLPEYLSSDNDPLFRFHRSRANLRVEEVAEIKAIPDAPRSHAFVERLIGTIRRECLDRISFWGRSDLERKLDMYKTYYNQPRCHTGLSGATQLKRVAHTRRRL